MLLHRVLLILLLLWLLCAWLRSLLSSSWLSLHLWLQVVVWLLTQLLLQPPVQPGASLLTQAESMAQPGGLVAAAGAVLGLPLRLCIALCCV